MFRGARSCLPLTKGHLTGLYDGDLSFGSLFLEIAMGFKPYIDAFFDESFG